MDIIIIAPHIFCPEGSAIRQCDRRTPEVVGLMREISGARVFEADRLRSEVDHNRAESRDYPMRRKFRDTLRASIGEGKKIVIYEIHSFPPDSGGFAGHHIGFLALDGHPPYHEQMRQLSRELLDQIPELRIYQGTGTRHNDLMLETSQLSDKLDVEHYLIEFNESSDELPSDLLKKICRVLVDRTAPGYISRIGSTLSGLTRSDLFNIIFAVVVVAVMFIILFLIVSDPSANTQHIILRVPFQVAQKTL